MRAAGIGEVKRRDYFSDASALQELQALNVRLGIPPTLQSHLVTVVDERVILAGHIPGPLLRGLLLSPIPIDRLLVFQDLMVERPRSYRLWTFKGEAEEFPMDTPIGTALSILGRREGGGLVIPDLMLATVVSAGLLDGLNPCAFAVLIFLVAFLFAIRKLRRDVMKIGLAFIVAVYITYFLIGAGLLKGLVSIKNPHLIGWLGAYLLVLLGSIGILNQVFPRLPLRLTLPYPGWERIRGWIYRATIPAAIVAGSLVGFCTLPCSGGIYVATLGLLAGSATYLKGLGYLSIYNAANILPLVGILLAIGNRYMSVRMARWERIGSRKFRIIFALMEVSLGVVILVWLM